MALLAYPNEATETAGASARLSAETVCDVPSASGIACWVWATAWLPVTGVPESGWGGT